MDTLLTASKAPREVRPLLRQTQRESTNPVVSTPASAGECLLHLQGLGQPIRGQIASSPRKCFVPRRGDDLGVIRQALVQGQNFFAAIERLTASGRRTRRLTPVMACRLAPAGGVFLREMVVVGQ